ncbi:MAG TPA: hypothetical protein VM261_31905 [Kofleriaceae bacterium]|nr:hypothetical protein [Kofleriaceae bacterium]
MRATFAVTVVCACVCAAPSVAGAESESAAAWKAAAWEAAANLLDHVAAKPSIDPAVRAHAAHGAFRARRKTFEHDVRVRSAPPDAGDHDAKPKPRPLAARDQRLVASLDTFLALVPTERSDRVAIARFLRGNMYRRHHQYEKAIPDLVFIVEHLRAHEVGLYAVNLLLDSYIVTERHAELVALARRLRDDAALAARDEALAERLRLIDVIGTRKEAEQLEQQARASGDRAAYVACGETYDRSLALAVDRYRDDEMLYNAAVCFQSGGVFTTALARHATLVRRFPRSPLVGRSFAHALGLGVPAAAQALARPLRW